MAGEARKGIFVPRGDTDQQISSSAPSISTDSNKPRNLVRDQGVGGSNPLSPTNVFNHLQTTDLNPVELDQVLF